MGIFLPFFFVAAFPTPGEFLGLSEVVKAFLSRVSQIIVFKDTGTSKD